MAANALIQTRIDPDNKKRAAAVLDAMGMSVSDAVRILLTRTANEGGAVRTRTGERLIQPAASRYSTL